VVGAGAFFISMIFLDYRVSIFLLFQIWFGCFSGWGCWFFIESAHPCGRASEFDWLLGRQDVENWTLSRRVVLDYAGMGLRGLQWTAPAGYFMWQRGLGSLFLVGGSLMAPVYYLTQQGPIGGTETSEWTWGAFLWAFIIFGYLRNVALFGTPSKYQLSTVEFRRRDIHRTALDFTFGRFYKNCRREFKIMRRIYKLFNTTLVYILCLIFLASTMFYGLIVQEDMRNKGQTLFGILSSSVLLLIVVMHYESKDYYVRKIHAKITPFSF